MSEPTPRPIQFGMDLVVHRANGVSAETRENLYLERAPKGSKPDAAGFKYVLMDCAGLVEFATTETGLVRGMIAMGAYLFVIVGQRCYRIAEDGTTQDLWEIEGTGYVALAENGTHIWCATSNKLYALNASECLEMPESGFVAVGQQDGYLLAAKRGSSDWFISGIDDATTIDPLDFDQADAFSDTNVGCVSDDQEFLIFGLRSIEMYRNTGNAAFPFERTHVVEYGCISGQSIARAAGSIFWLGQGREGGLAIYSMAGSQVQAITAASPWIVSLLEAQSSPQTARGICYQIGGHTFYALTFTDLTIEYDLQSGLWHKRKSDGMDRWRVSAHAWHPEWRLHLVGDYSTGQVYRLDLDTFTEGGRVLRRRAVSAPLYNNGLGFINDEFMLDIQAGVGLVSGQGSDPQAVLDWSDDGGATWGSELWRSFGAIGEREARARWLRLGRSRNRHYRVTVTDPVPCRISGAFTRIEGLTC